MTIENILRDNKSFRGARVISGLSGIANEVLGIMVLEAADIEHWGRKGQLLLSSFYALQTLDEEHARRFFETSALIGISGIVLKLGRLISDIPAFMIDYCEQYSIPLITIPQETRYEDVILSITAPLLKQMADEQASMQKYNTLVHDLLNDHMASHDALDQALNHLHLDAYPYYQTATIQFPDFQSALPDESRDAAGYFAVLRQELSDRKCRFAYEQMHDRMFLILNIPGEEAAFYLDTLRPLLDSFKLHYQCTISSVQDRYHITQLNRQALDAQRLGSLLYTGSFLLTYESLGIYRLFLNDGSLEKLTGMISPAHIRLRNEDRELWDTLETYVVTGMNYAKTGELLYLHPKTIKYRMDKLEKQLGLDFTDSETTFRIMLDTRLFRLLDHYQPKG